MTNPSRGRSQRARRVSSAWVRRVLAKKGPSTLSEFRQEVEGKTFRNPDTGNDVLFQSLPRPEQARIFSEWRRRQKGIEPRRERERGLVEINEKQAKWVAGHLANIASNWLVRDPDEKIGERFTPAMGRGHISAGTVMIRDVRGRRLERPVRLMVGEPSPGLWRAGRHYVTGGSVPTRHVGERDHGTPMSVDIKLNPDVTYADLKKNRSKVEREIYSVLTHELTHAGDVLETPNQQEKHRQKYPSEEGASPQDRVHAQNRAYYNKPSEVRAFKRQVADEVRRELQRRYKTHEFKKERAKEKGVDFDDDPNWIDMDAEAVMDLLERSVTWDRVRPFLNKKNRRKFLETVASVVRKFREDRGGKVAGRVASRWISAQEKKRKPFAWMDTETTGFNPRKQEIISISMLDEEGNPLLKHPKTGQPLHEVRITPQNLDEASPQALEINRYSEEAWKDSVPFSEVADQLEEIMKTHRLAGHNVAFDRDFLEADMAKAGRPVKADPEVVDTMALSYLAGIPSNKLGVTADVLGIPLGDAAHGAYPDTEASRKVWEQLRDPKKVEEVRARMAQEYGGPSRGVVFTAMETSGDNPWKDDISRVAVVDHHGDTVYDASVGDGEGQVAASQVAQDLAEIYQDNMFGGDDPKREAAFVRSFLKRHGPKDDEGKPKLGLYSPVLDTSTLRHVYGAGRRPSEKGSLVDQARAEAETFHEVADKAFGPSRPHRSRKTDFDSWAQGRTFRHPLSRDDPRRKRDFITYTTLKGLAETGGASGEQDVKEKASKHLQRLQKQFDAWQSRVQTHKRATRVAHAWLKRAISQKHIDKLMQKVETEDLPFDHLFQGKRRMAIDPEEYGGLGATQPSSASDIRQFLFNTEIVKSTDKIDWKKGLITDADGKVKSRLGKAIGKGVRKAMGKDAPLFRAMAKVEKERGKGTADTPIGRASQDYNFRGLIGFGKFVDPDFPAERAWKEMDTFGFPSPETWKEIKKVGDKFSKMSVEERKDVRDRHEAEYEEKKSQKVEGPRPRGFPAQSSMSPEYRNQYWAARGLYSSHIPQRVNDDGADMERWFRRWLDNTDELYEGPEGEPLRQVFELSRGVPEERLKQLKQLSDLKQKEQDYALWKSLYGEDLSIVLSRDPVDVIRMSDHPKAVQAIESCHSEGGSEFSCAVEEAEEGGLVAYVVRKSDIEGKDLDEGELFEDPDRGVKGVKPYSRLRLRRFENDEQGGGLEVAVPETTVYGADFDNLVAAVTEWARREQPEFLQGDAGYSKRPSDWKLTGGAYQDNPSSDLFNNFFDREEDDRWGREPTEDEYDPYGEGYTLEDSPYYDPDAEDEDEGEAEVSERTVEPWRYTDRMTDFWDWMKENHPKIPNPNRRGREDYITPSTLKGYARGRAGYSAAARETVGRYLARYQEQRKEYAEARARGDVRASRVAQRWLRGACS